MVKIKIHALYDHFPERTPAEGDKYIEMYADTYVTECTHRQQSNVAMMLEPRSMIGSSYDYVRNHADLFSLILTHDSELLKLPQAKMLNWADVWCTTDSEKTKGISIITSPKNWCPLHHARIRLADYFADKDKVDVYRGDWNNPQIPEIKAQDYLEHYKYSIIIENDIDEYWYTEKILNCFANKVVPIYVGASKIGEIFNPDGIIQVRSCDEIPAIVESLDIDRDYALRQQAIDDNFKRVEPYKVPWKKRLFADYESLMEELING